jgi:deoxyribodipyrimidine photo-lyase
MRNHVLPGHANVSRLSAALRHRLITEAEVVEAVLRRHSFRAAEKFVQEVLWRSYWKGWLELRPEVWDGYRAAAGRRTMDGAPAEVTAGRSGSGVMNLFARELLETGYLHNHARMWWASFWVHHCGLPWELGARHFFDHLLDADPASNTLSWRWVAGLQTRGKAYLATEQNIRKYTAPELLESAGGIGLTEPIAARIPAEDAEANGRTETPPAFPQAVEASDVRTVLLLHDEDLSVERGPAAGLRPMLIVSFIAPTASPEPPPRARWLSLARADAARRAAGHFGVEVRGCGSCVEVAQACAEAGAGRVVMVEPPVGPVREALAGLPDALASRGIVLERVRRRWDAELWPLAGRGFFPFWSKVGRRLEKRGVGAFA